MIGVYLTHSRVLVAPGCQLSDRLFDINTPFYMKSEEEAIKRRTLDEAGTSRKRRRKLKVNLYEEQLSVSEKTLIAEVVDRAKSLDLLNADADDLNNDSAMKVANQFIPKIYLEENVSFSNRNDCPTRFKQKFLIPPKCSFSCGDVKQGLQSFRQFYLEQKFRVGQHFSVVIDPPWPNKSVKRKCCYELEDKDSIWEVFNQLKTFICSLPPETLVSVFIWTTSAAKLFVKDLISLLDLQCSHEFLWHKITKKGESTKIRGGSEYLLIASSRKTAKDCFRGVLVSIPSALHSHKPPIDEFLLKKIENLGDNENILILNENQNWTHNQILTHIPSLCLTRNSVYSQLTGLELYARYLREGFHSIGKEVIKLQHQVFYQETVS